MLPSARARLVSGIGSTFWASSRTMSCRHCPADVAVAPSVSRRSQLDGLPNTVMEIMSSGTPLIATPAGEKLRPIGTRRVFVPERDVRALAAAIDDMLRESSAAAAIGRQARETAATRLGARRRRFRGRLPTMLSAIGWLLLIAYLPGQSSFGCRLQIARSAPRYPPKNVCSGR